VFRAFSYAQTYNVFGLPAVTVPAGQSDTGLPIGIQIIARPFAEATALAAAAIVEDALSLTSNHGLTRANPLERHYRDVLCGRVHTPQDDSTRIGLGRAALGL